MSSAAKLKATSASQEKTICQNAHYGELQLMKKDTMVLKEEIETNTKSDTTLSTQTSKVKLQKKMRPGKHIFLLIFQSFSGDLIQECITTKMHTTNTLLNNSIHI